MRALLLAASLALLLPPSPAAAQTSYPTKPVTIVVPYAPGGASDGLARALAQRLATALRQPVVVDNKAGGNTVIGASAVAKAPADGQTLLLTAEATLVMNPHLYAKLPYNADTGFTPIAVLANVPQGLVVPGTSALTSVGKFTAAARESPGKTTYATLGPGSTAHLNMELFQRATGTQLAGVPYRGAAPALTDLMGAHVQSMIVSVGLVAPHVQAGKLRLLAVAGSKRHPLVPDVPTFSEAGVGGFAPSSWFALLAPAGTPPAVVARLNAEVNKVLSDPAFKAEVLDKAGLEAVGGSPEQLTQLMKAEDAKWSVVVREARIKLE